MPGVGRIVGFKFLAPGFDNETPLSLCSAGSSGRGGFQLSVPSVSLMIIVSICKLYIA